MKNFGKGLEQSQLFKRGLLLIVADNALTCNVHLFKSIWLYIYLDREHLDLTIENVQSAINSYRLWMAAGIKKNKIDFGELIFTYSVFLNETHSLIKSSFGISPTMPMVFYMCQSFPTRRC